MRTWTATTTAAAGPDVGFDVHVLEAASNGLRLTAEGPVGLDVDYALAATACGSQMHAREATL